MTRNPTLAIIAFALTIPAANWLIGNVGTTCIPQGPCLIPVGFGFMAPSGVLMIGLALVLRDLVHELAGWKWALVAVLIGAGLSLLTSPPALAIASAAAFLLAELADLAVYSRLRSRGMALAVAASGVVGAALDSALFVWLAFGSLEFSVGTTLAKIYGSAAVATWFWMRPRCWHKWGAHLATAEETSKFESHHGDPWQCLYDPSNYQTCSKCGTQRARPGSEIDGLGSGR